MIIFKENKPFYQQSNFTKEYFTLKDTKGETEEESKISQIETKTSALPVLKNSSKL